MEKLCDLDLYNDDCFNVFDKIEGKSVNLFLLDLPYNQTVFNWDKDIIPLNKMWEHIKRIMKPNGIIIFFCSARFGYKLIQSNPKWFSYDLVWKKSRKVGFLQANKMPLRQHENIYIFKDTLGTYNPQKTKGKPYKCSRGETGYYGNMGLNYTKKYKIENKGDRHPTSLIEYQNPQRTIHRTQKPIKLCEWLIKTYSNEGETVIDFTMGSGTVALACLNTNRKFIGIEKDKEIYEKAENRIIEHLENLP